MKIIGPFSQIVTLRALPLKGALQDEQLEIISNGAVVVDDDGFIVDVQTYQEILHEYPGIKKETIQTPCTLVPGIIDAHTHICFGGKRSMDFAARNNGKSYLEIAKKGGGIWSTVTQTRNASQETLFQLTMQRLDTALKSGITTMELKSGYGLSKKEELKILRAIQQAKEAHQVDVKSTCLAAHIKPKDFAGDTADYLDYILLELVPAIQEEQLTKRFDIFIEQSAFWKEESKTYLQALKNMGFDLTVHGDQFTPGGSEVAIEVGALSVDHLEASTEKEIIALAKSDVVAVALPGASIGLGVAFTPARKLLDLGACLAIASDWNPGSAPHGDLLTQAAILSTYEKLSAAEVWAGITFRAARALNLDDRGTLEPNKVGDMVAFPTEDYRDILYYQGQMRPIHTWMNGKKCF